MRTLTVKEQLALVGVAVTAAVAGGLELTRPVLAQDALAGGGARKGKVEKITVNDEFYKSWRGVDRGWIRTIGADCKPGVVDKPWGTVNEYTGKHVIRVEIRDCQENWGQNREMTTIFEKR